MTYPNSVQATIDSVLSMPVSELSDFQQVVEEVDVGICIIQDGSLQYVNPKYAEMHGATQSQVIGADFMQLVHPDSHATVIDARRLRDAGLHNGAYVALSVRLDGSTFHVRVLGRNIIYQGRHASLTTLTDITELVEMHRVSAWRGRMLLSNELLCKSGSIEVMMSRRLVRVSAGTRSILQLDKQAARTPLRTALRAVPAHDRPGLLAQWRQATPGTPFEYRHRLQRPDGTLVHVLHKGLIEAVDGTGPRPVAILQDITEQVQAERRIDTLANYHPVTGMATRPLLLRRTGIAIEAALKGGRPFALMYVRVPDIDHLRDSIDNEAADGLAGTMASRLLAACRAEDSAAHLGGGEFALLLDPIAGADKAMALSTATRLLSRLSSPSTYDRSTFVAESQIGIALFPGDAVCAAELLEHARAACGRAGMGINFFTREVADSVSRRNRVDAALREAIERNELTLHYQPQVDLRSGAVVGVEALLRWRSVELGEVSPVEFIPIAEQNGLILPIGEWVFRKACEQSAAWARAGVRPVRVGVNLSPRQLEQANISQRLQQILLETGADPERMGIEVTESVLMRDLEHARRTLTELSAIGIELSLDDFGTGYSNLKVLRALPFDVLKIDRSLVHDVTAATEDVSITRSVLALAKSMKLKVLAEGVETEGQLALLISNGCDYMQGYIFSKPMPVHDIEQLLLDGTRLPDRYLSRGERQRTLLLVDDEENVLSSLRRLLRGAGYQIVVARTVPEALGRLAEYDVDVILSDQRMPGMTGVEFLRRAKELYPETIRLVLSGYTELQSVTDSINEGAIHKFLTKPWDDTVLRDHVAEAFRCKEMADENRRLSRDVSHANLELMLTNERQQRQLTAQCERLSIEEVRAVNAQGMLHNLPTPLIGIDADGIVAFANDQARALLAPARALVGGDATQVLPTEWQRSWRQPDGRHRRSRFGRVDCLISCTPVAGDGASRGHLLTVIPIHDSPEELAP